MDKKIIPACSLLCLALAGGAASTVPRAPVNLQAEAGGFHSALLKDDGSVWAWGLNAWGQLGNGRMGGLAGWRENTSIPTAAKDVTGENMKGIVLITAGYHHNVALKKDGILLAWGDNDRGQLGDGTREDRPLPVQVKGPGGKGLLTDIVKIAAGYHYTAAVKKDATVWIWGHNGSGMWGRGDGGQLGAGTDGKGENRFILTPVQIKGPEGNGYLGDVKDIAAGARHTVALKKDGTVWVWGSNSDGQLGDGTTTNRMAPVQVAGPGGQGFLTGIKAVAAGVAFTVALAEDGGVLAWGNNHFGQLGDGSTNNSSLPVRVKAPNGAGELKDVAAISAGSRHVLALTSEGKVLAWGFNGSGQLGDGSLLSRSVAATVRGQNTNILADVSCISAGYEHSLALKKNGMLLAWGGNSVGQLGSADKTTLDAVEPVMVREPPAPVSVEHGEGQWLLMGRPTFRPGLKLDVPGPDGALAPALRHVMKIPTLPERGGPGAAPETESTLLDFTPVTEGFLNISFDVRVSSADSRTLDITLFQEGGHGWSHEAWSLIWGKQTGKLSDLGGALTDIDCEWRNYRIVSNLDNHTYDVWVEGDWVAESRPFRSKPDAGTPFGRLRIGITHGGMIDAGSTVVDGEYADIANIRISTEPLKTAND